MQIQSDKTELEVEEFVRFAQTLPQTERQELVEKVQKEL